jgi:hypothetical protein
MSLPCSFFVTKDYANETYLTISNAKNLYLSKSAASSIYLTTSKAYTIFLTKISAASTYLSLNDATTLYLSKINAESIYLKINTASQTYVDLTSTQTITGTKTFNTLYLNSSIYDSFNSTGLIGQVLSTTGSGVKWIDVSSASTGSYVNYPIAQGSQTMLDTDISGTLSADTIQLGTINTDLSYLSLNPNLITSNNYDGTTQSIIKIGSFITESIPFNGISIMDKTTSDTYTIISSSTFTYYEDSTNIFQANTKNMMYAGNLFGTDGLVTITSDQTISGTKTFNNIYVLSSFYDSSLSYGTTGQILSTTETGVKWINNELNDYLTIQDASNTYLTINDASNSYLNYPVAQGKQYMLDTDICGTLMIRFPYSTSNSLITLADGAIYFDISTNNSHLNTNNLYFSYQNNNIINYLNLDYSTLTYGIVYVDDEIENYYQCDISDIVTLTNNYTANGFVDLSTNQTINGSKTFNTTITLPNTMNIVDASNTVHLFPSQESMIQIGSTTYNESQTNGIRLPKYIDSVDLTSGILLGYNHTGGYLRSNLAMVFDAESTANNIHVNYLHPTTDTTGTLYIGNLLTSGNVVIGNPSMTGNITIESPSGYIGISGAIKLTHTRTLTSTDELGYYYYSTTTRSIDVSSSNSTAYIFSPQSSDSTPPTILPVGIYRIDINGTINANSLNVNTLSYQFGYCTSTTLPMTSSNTTRTILTSVTNDTSFTSSTTLQTRSVFAGGVFTSNGTSYYTGWGSVTFGSTLTHGTCDVSIISIFITRIA